jgi:ribosomal protein S27E
MHTIKELELPKGPDSESRFRKYNCPGCSATMVFSPLDSCLKCEYCGRSEQIPVSLDQVEECSYEEYLVATTDQMGKLNEVAIESLCESCGAMVSFVPPVVSGECSFCGSKTVVQDRSPDPLVAPMGLLPFQIRAEDAKISIKRWISGLWFAPNKLKKLARHEGVSGIYIPYWTYDTHTTTIYSGERGEHYYVKVNNKQQRRTRWYPSDGTLSLWFDDVLVPATKSLCEKRLHQLEPWDLTNLKQYDPHFLLGYKAQRYQIDLLNGFGLAKSIMKERITTKVRESIGGDEQRINSMSTSYSAITFKHILLPVYAGAYRFKDQTYQLVVNARTGEVHGERPYSIIKIALFVLFILTILMILSYITEG